MNCSIVLVEPSKPQNLGSILRVMMNFNIKELFLVNPKVDLSHKEIGIVARKAEKILQSVQVFHSLAEVKTTIPYLIGTVSPRKTGGDYNLRRIALPPEQLEKIDDIHDKIGLVFGSEQDGLSNADIDLCDMLISVPTSDEYPVMNLSHAVAVCSYFIYKKAANEANDIKKTTHRAALQEEVSKLLETFEKLLVISEYHKEKQHIAYRCFKNILSRGYVTGREVTTLIGVFKWATLNIERNK